MADAKILEDLSIEELRAELRARKARYEGVLAAPASESLKGFDDATIIGTLKFKQKVIYGTDDRLDRYEVSDAAILADADSVVAIFQAASVNDNGDGTSTLTTENFGDSNDLCQTERFRDQPIGAFCSGFLVAPDIVATAGHCVNANTLASCRFVFGFYMESVASARLTISNQEIYRGIELLGRQEVGTGPDWSLVRIDRPVTNHRAVSVRREGKIPDSQAVHVIGHPCGLPQKFAGGAGVRSNEREAFFVANLDTYGGNSGSPVFNSGTHQVEGILVRGETDFAQQGNCSVSLVCPSTGCRGEDCTRTTEFASLIPV
jgi:hypothetical protein